MEWCDRVVELGEGLNAKWESNRVRTQPRKRGGLIPAPRIIRKTDLDEGFYLDRYSYLYSIFKFCLYKGSKLDLITFT